MACDFRAQDCDLALAGEQGSAVDGFGREWPHEPIQLGVAGRKPESDKVEHHDNRLLKNMFLIVLFVHYKIFYHIWNSMLCCMQISYEVVSYAQVR